MSELEKKTKQLTDEELEKVTGGVWTAPTKGTENENNLEDESHMIRKDIQARQLH